MNLSVNKRVLKSLSFAYKISFSFILVSSEGGELLLILVIWMSQLAEKIAKLREFGLGVKSDTELHQLH